MSYSERLKNKVSRETKFFFNRIGLINRKFLFILSPPFCGSTLLSEMLCTSRSISTNNEKGTREGQTLPKVFKIMFGHDRRWDETLDFDWPTIKKEWMKYWHPMTPIWLEKSPPNIIRAQSISRHFQPAYFIVLHRNPYAHSESLMRRRKMKKSVSLEETAQFVIQCLRYQKRNIEQLDKVLQISYESLTDDHEQFRKQLISFLPALSDVNFKGRFNAHNFKAKPLGLTNLNQEKIDRLSAKEMYTLNTFFRKEEALLSYFGYSIID